MHAKQPHAEQLDYGSGDGVKAGICLQARHVVYDFARANIWLQNSSGKV